MTVAPATALPPRISQFMDQSANKKRHKKTNFADSDSGGEYRKGKVYFDDSDGSQLNDESRESLAIGHAKKSSLKSSSKLPKFKSQGPGRAGPAVLIEFEDSPYISEEDITLNDKTPIGASGLTWQSIKSKGMSSEYKQQSWFKDLP